jgi:hypothetical protein
VATSADWDECVHYDWNIPAPLCELKIQAMAGLPPGSVVWYLSNKAWKGACIAAGIEEIIEYSIGEQDYHYWILPPEFEKDDDFFREARCHHCQRRFKDHP